MGFNFSSGSYLEPAKSVSVRLLFSSNTTSLARMASPSSGRSGAGNEGLLELVYAESILGYVIFFLCFELKNPLVFTKRK